MIQARNLMPEILGSPDPGMAGRTAKSRHQAATTHFSGQAGNKTKQLQSNRLSWNDACLAQAGLLSPATTAQSSYIAMHFDCQDLQACLCIPSQAPGSIYDNPVTISASTLIDNITLRRNGGTGLMQNTHLGREETKNGRVHGTRGCVQGAVQIAIHQEDLSHCRDQVWQHAGPDLIHPRPQQAPLPSAVL